MKYKTAILILFGVQIFALIFLAAFALCAWSRGIPYAVNDFGELIPFRPFLIFAVALFMAGVFVIFGFLDKLEKLSEIETAQHDLDKQISKYAKATHAVAQKFALSSDDLI
jgi:hypothetical protein